MEFPALCGQALDCDTDDFALGMERLQRTKQRAGIDKHALNPIKVNALAAHGLVG